MPEGFLTTVDGQILNEVIKLAKTKKIGEFDDKGDLSPAFSSYLEQMVRYATGEDKIWSEPESLLWRAVNAWKNAETREPHQDNIALRIEDGKNWTEKRLVLDIASDDKPFIVDSISAALSEAGKPVSFFSNAVIDAPRDEHGNRLATGDQTIRESMIHVEMDPPVSEGELDNLRNEITLVLNEVDLAVADWEPMRARLEASIKQLQKAKLSDLKKIEKQEAINFLKWVLDNRFAFLGVRKYEYNDEDGNLQFEHNLEQDLGILKNPERRILKSTYQASGDLSPAVEAFLESSEPILITKANARSLVHRRAHMDYIGVKIYSPDGKVIGEERFVGLFTSDAYNRPAAEIPLISAKMKAVIDATAFRPGGHNEKALLNILETYPRDELFQADVDSLRETSLGILRLYKRPRVKLFLRRDRFDRFVSAFVFIPRDRFNSDTREQVGDLLAKTYNGRVAAFSPSFGDAALVRAHFIIAIEPGAPDGPGLTYLTRQMRALCRNWSDGLLSSMQTAHGGVTPVELFSRYEKAFSTSYKEFTKYDDALLDIACLELLKKQNIVVRAYRSEGDGEDVVRVKIYRCGGPFALSKLIPTIENLGLDVIREAGHLVQPSGLDAMWIHDFHTAHNKTTPINLDEVQQTFEDAILAVLTDAAEDDGFNALVLTAGISWREAWLLRAAAKHHQQAGFAYSPAYVVEALCNHPSIARDLVAAFHARFNPAGPRKFDDRKTFAREAEEKIFKKLDDVDSLDEDRIISRFLNLFSAITRTNYYQRTAEGDVKPYISFKIESNKLDELPKPRPYREIFVSGPRVDGVHLRFGPIARGGIRWSDRREDFRTEALGLVKAQRVKNAVIVPNGSKGGFYPKQLPQTKFRDAIFEEGREAYKIFIRGLLDLTDNLSNGKIQPPKNVISWDEPDPYLVVAADKGTAQFSDTANAISEEYGFWLGDAFASGGSVGYDHKVMGITARGAWEAVKRHFREMGKDIQTESFTAAGVGDMSGDVFGNGMLLSKKTRLIAAFDHRDIFIDPDPDPTKSYKERKRLFDLPRSSWKDYDPELISKGGGVFSRSAKSIRLSAEIRKVLDITNKTLPPNQLIKAILNAPVELFWLGGIGTYFKAESEENWRVGDRANDAVRINASEMRIKVIGEGANLGLTQLARIEFARSGGRINTDAIDYSAGVDSSDHEVNIKILLSAAIEQSELKADERNELLASMTDDVATHVLRHNYQQTRALSDMERSAPANLDIHSRFTTTLEHSGRPDRAIEYLPDTEQFMAMRQQNIGLSRPELSVLFAYAKLWLFDELVASDAPDDPIFERELFAYFPKALHKFTKPITTHQLRREIIATRLSNEIVDTCGISFAQRVVETTGVDFATVALAYEAVRRIYDLESYAREIDQLDNKIPAALQTALLSQASNLLREQVFHMLSDQRSKDAILQNGLKSVIARYQAPVTEFKKALPDILPTHILPSRAAKALEARRAHWLSEGVPEALAFEAAGLPALEYSFDIVDLAATTGWSNPGAGSVYFATGRLLNIDTLREKAQAEPLVEHYDNVAIRQMNEDLAARQRRLTREIILFAGAEPKGPPAEWVEKLVARWAEVNDTALKRFETVAGELDLAGAISVGKYTLFIRKIDELIESASS
ncbi:MAG: NAD-glutamate dehydrogenase [Marinicaulis sp.]|nr:NAD-glutamate dehydrogenase [Marinicaulis sp.]